MSENDKLEEIIELYGWFSCSDCAVLNSFQACEACPNYKHIKEIMERK